MDAGFQNLSDFDKRFPDEQSCRDYLEQARWKGQIVCPHCKADTIYRFSNGQHFKCGTCKKKFTVKVGSIFEDSSLPLRKWFHAVYVLTAHKKGISSIQLGKDIGVTQKSAWFMLHRIRYAITAKSFDAPLAGFVEVDETYVGGKPRKGEKRDKPRKRGRGTEKAPVIGMVSRETGELRMVRTDSIKAKDVGKIIAANVTPKATLLTDDLSIYKSIGKAYVAHESVNHSQKEYVRGEFHTNTIEGSFSLLKRSIIGIYHQVSKEHLHRYCNECSFRYSTRKQKDSERFVSTLSKIEGRLTHKELIAQGRYAKSKGQEQAPKA